MRQQRLRVGGVARASAMPIEAVTWNSAPATMNGSARHAPISATTRSAAHRVVVQVGEQHQEAVPAGAGEHVRGAERLLQPRGQEPHQLVAGAVAERVVDELEVVEVDVQQRDSGAGAAERASASLRCSSSIMRLAVRSARRGRRGR